MEREDRVLLAEMIVLFHLQDPTIHPEECSMFSGHESEVIILAHVTTKCRIKSLLLLTKEYHSIDMTLAYFLRKKKKSDHFIQISRSFELPFFYMYLRLKSRDYGAESSIVSSTDYIRRIIRIPSLDDDDQIIVLRYTRLLLLRAQQEHEAYSPLRIIITI